MPEPTLQELAARIEALERRFGIHRDDHGQFDGDADFAVVIVEGKADRKTAQRGEPTEGAE